LGKSNYVINSNAFSIGLPAPLIADFDNRALQKIRISTITYYFVRRRIFADVQFFDERFFLRKISNALPVLPKSCGVFLPKAGQYNFFIADTVSLNTCDKSCKSVS